MSDAALRAPFIVIIVANISGAFGTAIPLIWIRVGVGTTRRGGYADPAIRGTLKTLADGLGVFIFSFLLS